jgi:hypothetical protein
MVPLYLIIYAPRHEHIWVGRYIYRYTSEVDGGEWSTSLLGRFTQCPPDRRLGGPLMKYYKKNNTFASKFQKQTLRHDILSWSLRFWVIWQLSMATILCARWQRNRGSISGWGKIIYLLLSAWTLSGAQPTFYTTGTGNLSPVVKRQ